MNEAIDYTRNTAQGVERIRTRYSCTYVMGQCRAVIGLPLNGEYRVRLMHHAQRIEGADYFTDDKNDAHGTAQQMVLQLAKQVQGGAA